MNGNVAKLKNIIDISRIHFYKPIQVAEILYRYRKGVLDSFEDREKIRKESKKWRDNITLKFINSKCSSSAKFQDDLFSATAIPFDSLSALGEFNNAHNGVLEAFVYTRFLKKHDQLKNALDISKMSTFDVEKFVNSFTEESGLKRSTDKIYEIIIYSLFEELLDLFGVSFSVSLDNQEQDIHAEFEGFANLVLDLKEEFDYTKNEKAHFFRAGITNAADRGIDLYANSGQVVQVKHVDLDNKVLQGIGSSISSNRIVIVCKRFHEKTISTVLHQLGFENRIQSIITFEKIYEWYSSAFTGKYSESLAPKIQKLIGDQISLEFPVIDNQDFDQFLVDREYKDLNLSILGE
jgi:type II restriction enzyme